MFGVNAEAVDKLLAPQLKLGRQAALPGGLNAAVDDYDAILGLTFSS